MRKKKSSIYPHNLFSQDKYRYAYTRIIGIELFRRILKTILLKNSKMISIKMHTHLKAYPKIVAPFMR